MTSMLFTVRSDALEVIVLVVGVARAANAWICLLTAHACRFDSLLRGVLGGRLLHHFANQRAVAAHPIRGRLPLLTVPLLEAHISAAAVVGAGHLDRRHHRAKAELVEAVLIEREIFDPPTHLLP